MSTQVPLDAIARALRRERDRSGLSLSEVAKRANVAKSTLSQLEAGAGNPSVETLWALAVALQVPFARLVERTEPRVQVIRAGEGAGVGSEQANFVGTLLAACPPAARRDIYVITAEPGTPRVADPHPTGTVEHVTVASGRIRTGPADSPIELNTGDYASFPGDVAHLYDALEAGSWAVLVMEHV